MPRWTPAVKVDDFLVAIGKKQSNSVYHIASVRSVLRPGKRITRYHMQVYKSDLITCLNRDSDQQLITLFWYNRNKKK